MYAITHPHINFVQYKCEKLYVDLEEDSITIYRVFFIEV